LRLIRHLLAPNHRAYIEKKNFFLLIYQLNLTLSSYSASAPTVEVITTTSNTITSQSEKSTTNDVQQTTNLNINPSNNVTGTEDQKSSK
jgi:hypothetical protein